MFRIFDILGSIDDKIENNEKIVKKLEKYMQFLFEKQFGNPKHAIKSSNLLEIASFTNGLAMQKYRPKSDEYLPVLKIRELAQGFIDYSSEKADTYIKQDYIIEDGDIVFSWSGTLMVKIWCGGKCGLNQHLFKVTSSKFPKWFCYLWTLKYLKVFQNIAEGKAVTMGHIKREDLSKAVVYIPNENIMKIYSPILNNIFESTINKQKQIIKLRQLKQLYLKKFFDFD